MLEKQLNISPSPEDCRALRRSLGWSTQQLAARAGLAKKTVLDFETGARAPRSLTLIAIRRAFRQAGALPVRPEPRAAP